MADILSPEERSRNMAAIRSRDTKPEVYLRKLLFARGYRYRIANTIKSKELPHLNMNAPSVMKFLK